MKTAQNYRLEQDPQFQKDFFWIFTVKQKNSDQFIVLYSKYLQLPNVNTGFFSSTWTRISRLFKVT